MTSHVCETERLVKVKEPPIVHDEVSLWSAVVVSEIRVAVLHRHRPPESKGGETRGLGGVARVPRPEGSLSGNKRNSINKNNSLKVRRRSGRLQGRQRSPERVDGDTEEEW